MPVERPATLAPAARLNQLFRISRLLAGKVDFGSAIRAVSDEIALIVPHDHLDVCIMGDDGLLHTAYESGIDTVWGRMEAAPVAASPIRPILTGEVDHLLSRDACADPLYDPHNPVHRPVWDHGLRARVNVPLRVHGRIIGALSVSSHEPGRYGPEEVRNLRYVAELLSPYFHALRAAEQARLSAVTEAEARAREEGLRQGALRLTEALEQERQRIGMDLHDQTLADLTRIARGLDRLRAAGGPVDPAALGTLAQGLHEAMAALRQIIEAAKPSVLHLFGLAHALENHLDRAIRDSGLPIRGTLCDRTDGALDALDPAVAVAVLRILQEAVNNAVHHSGATELRIDLTLARGLIVLSVEDDGAGLPQGGRRRGNGIDNMRTRARLIAARFWIGAGAGGRGTRVRLSLARPGPPPEAGTRLRKDAGRRAGA
ncbi:MAG: GAF domain-containing protein [Rubellimicrobium sp.]|nr:GAF domain-containing protein [Rubellimicrobium sp.]